LAAAGYNYILIDDGWPECETFTSDGGCNKQTPRDTQGRIVVSKSKFPNGFLPVTTYVHNLGLKIGIYTAVSHRTCGGYTGSLANERIDAQSFADWGFDFVKYDTCDDYDAQGNVDCNETCIYNSAVAMRDGLNATKRPIVYYIDDGNDSTGPRVWNPKGHSVDKSNNDWIKMAHRWQDLVWVWGADVTNMWKSWFDRSDNWNSVMDNAHMQIGLAPYAKCGAFNMPDMLTVGQGGLTQGQSRVEFFTWAILTSPLILGVDIRKMDNFSLTLVTNSEILAVNQDTDCVQASNSRLNDAIDTWVKPLSDGTFAVVVVNKATTTTQATIYIQDRWNWGGGDFYPAQFDSATIRDLYNKQNLGQHTGTFNVSIPAQDAVIYKFTPV